LRNSVLVLYTAANVFFDGRAVESPMTVVDEENFAPKTGWIVVLARVVVGLSCINHIISILYSRR
jgi:hypothetical protein